MRDALLVARLLLAAVFAVAGVAKLADRTGTAHSIADFGVPSFLARPAARLLPLWELACAAALIPSSTSRWGGFAAGATLLAFAAAIAVNLARGRRPDCHCFGQLHSRPVGWTTVSRNIVLAAIAAFVISEMPLSSEAAAAAAAVQPAGVDPVTTALAWIAAALASFTLYLAFQLLRQNGRLLVRIEAIEAKLGIVSAERAPQGLSIDSAAPGFTAKDLDGAAVAIDPARDLAAPALLVFVEPGCSACDALLPDVARWQRDDADRVRTMVISRGTIGQNRNKSAKHGIRGVLLQNNREIANAYHVAGVPSAVFVVHGRIASALASGADSIRELAARVTGPGLRRGDTAPGVVLPDLRGAMLDVAVTNGRRALLLFWNPDCGFCQQMLDDVKAWERHAPDGAPELVVVAAGSPEANARQGFRSPVLLDPEFKTAQLFGVSGTPSAVLLDERRRVASDVAVGAESVLALANSAVPVKLSG